jgi:tRNA(fMet)-specific endonuclease VapC
MKQKQYLLDTCICAYWLRDKLNVRERINAVGMENCYISEITIAELKFGKAYGQRKGGPKYRDQPLRQFFDDINVLHIEPYFDIYAEEKARLALAGTPTGEFDLLIGCTAVAEDMIMVTENVMDFQNIQGIQIENWIERDKQD